MNASTESEKVQRRSAGHESSRLSVDRRRSAATAINTHSYPRLLHRSRTLFRAFHGAVHWTTLRNWYVRRAIRGMRLEEARRQTILDIGCGAGDHLYYAARKAGRAACIGVDRSSDAVALCRAHAPADGRMQFICRDLEDGAALPEADVIFCVTVLQYIREDAALLKSLRTALRRGGRMLLYVPIRNERVLGLYDRLITGSRRDYDAVQGRRRIYHPSDVLELLHESGFTVVSSEQAYGRFGKLSFELHSLLLHGATHDRLFVQLPAGAASLVLLPIVFLLMGLDYLLPVTRGNGLLLEAS